MRVKVDEDVCIGSMSCESSCPEVFQVVGGMSEVQVEVVPPELEGAVRDAVEGCPVAAIKIVEE